MLPRLMHHAKIQAGWRKYPSLWFVRGFEGNEPALSADQILVPGSPNERDQFNEQTSNVFGLNQAASPGRAQRTV